MYDHIAVNGMKRNTRVRLNQLPSLVVRALIRESDILRAV